MEKIKQIIWDRNGTLLNDVEMCMRVMNNLLQKYALPAVSFDRYKSIFDFPVQAYYAKLGFDFNKIPFEQVGHEFMDGYFSEVDKCDLYPDVLFTLDFFKSKGFSQVVLSAMEHNALHATLQSKGIERYFKQIQGIDNHLATSKVELAADLIKKTGISAEETLLIGDTLHDLEAAESIQCKCALISKGHFSNERLLAKHDLVFDSLSELKTNCKLF
ncbi:MAG: HAD family hydrolase [Bacteroidales bacterium]|nr:HAD family hydrolase [Bacteroidales bacterium]